jgi:hypothetical protein
MTVGMAESVTPRTFLDRLAGMVRRPRATIRAVLASDSAHRVPLLIGLVAVSNLVADFRWNAFRAFVRSAHPTLALLAPAGLVLLVAVSILLFYVCAWVVWLIGRLLEGAGSASDVRAALAWSLAPIIWALVYRIPAAFLLSTPLVTPGSPGNWTDLLRILRDAALLRQWGPELALAVVTLIVKVWCLCLAVVALAEAHRYSTWRAAATIAFALLLPVIVAAAYVMAVKL